MAISLPPLLVLAVAARHRRMGDHPAMQGFVRGLGLAVSSIFLVVVVDLLQANEVDWRSGLIVLASIGLALTQRLPAPLLLGLAGLAGVWLYG